MERPNKKARVSLVLKNAYPLLCLLSGLLVTQIIATAQVYFSNKDLHAGLELISNAGYLPIPNRHIMAHLQEFGPAFYGGLFFTLSLGVALSLLALAVSWIRIRIFPVKRWFPCVLLIPWSLLLLSINLHGFAPFASAYFLFVPIAVFWTTRELMPAASPKHRPAFPVIHALLILFLGLLWAWRMDGDIFMSVRDNFLLTGTSGISINDFYYRYAFYPAGVFKPLDQKTLKTCRIIGARNAQLNKSLEMKLLENDYIPVENTAQVDLAMGIEGKRILLQHHGKSLMTTTVPDFLAMGSVRMKEFSERTDRYVLFRKCVFLSLLFGLPAMAYLLLFVLVRFFSGLFFGPEASAWPASFVCFCAGIALWVAVTPAIQKGAPEKPLNEMLESVNAKERLTALKEILDKRTEISQYRAYEKLLKSPHISDRYWLTKTMAFSHNPETLKDLLAMLDDPSPNVVSMGYWSLGLRGNRSATSEILRRIPLSEEWYNQWYAYNALRNLGWKQTILHN